VDAEIANVGGDGSFHLASISQPEHQRLQSDRPSPLPNWVRVFESELLKASLQRSSVMRASCVNDSNNVPERAVKMRVVALITGSAGLYGRLADRAETEATRATYPNALTLQGRRFWPPQPCEQVQISARRVVYFPPQLRLFNSYHLPRLKRLFYFETVV
jgi:hypothetical protein